MARDFQRLLRPRSLAVLGGAWAENVIAQCRAMGYAGDVWPVHPNRSEINGLRAFPDLSALPAPPDAAFVGVNRHASVDVIGQLAAMEAGGATCFASGWAESGEFDLQSALVQAAGDMPILGPNCYGLINYLDGAIIWPDQHGGQRAERGVAIISQSSNIAINLTMQRRGLPIAYVACLGNAAQTGLVELARALIADGRVTALGLYVEGINDAPALAELAEEMHVSGKGIVALKAGRTEAGAQAAASHTAALAGTAAASSAYLAQCGICEVDTLDTLVETLKILHVHGPLGGRRLCSLSCSGGEAGLMADLSNGYGTKFEPPSATARAELSGLLGPLVTISNPLDYHTFIWGDFDTTTQVFSAMLADYDGGLFVIDPPRPDRCDPASFQASLDAIEEAARRTGRPAFPVASLPENFDEALTSAMMARGTVALCGMQTALSAVNAAMAAPPANGWRPWPARGERADKIMDEARSKDLLDDAGIHTPRRVWAESLAALRENLDGLRPPFALKGLGFAHKTEMGAVRLGLQTLDGEADMPGASGYLVEEMVHDCVAELLIGLRRDPVYGATVTIGVGGVAAELLKDTVTLVLPVTENDLRAAMERLRLWPLLDGYRGQPRADVGASVDVVLKLQRMLEHAPRLSEIEINPLIVGKHGAVAVDALIREDLHD